MGGVKVYVGMSGGVDSSVTAALLQQQGYDVTGVYMKNWTQDLPGMKCPWADDLADAKRVAVQLNIPFKVFDFQKEYKQKVVDYMIAEYRAGRTPNPDVMCNQEVKFKVFLDAALADGADMIATGHYARVAHGAKPSLADSSAVSQESLMYTEPILGIPSAEEPADRTQSALPETVSRQPLMYTEQVVGSPSVSGSAASAVGRSGLSTEGIPKTGSVYMSSFRETVDEPDRAASLLTAADTAKDQTYFLYRVTQAALAKTLFPLGELTKPQVRQKAIEFGLATAAKKDSQGICFVGKVGIKDFLAQYVQTQPGDVVDKTTGKVVGQHDGAIFYTFGQRHGLGVGGGLPYYVIGKDMAQNIIYVSTNLNDKNLWRTDLHLASLHWINQPPEFGKVYKVGTRYRAPLIDCSIVGAQDGELRLELHNPERAITPGQSAVLYDGERVVGGGIVV